MHFYRLDEVPTSRDDVVFKESPAFNAVWAVVLFGAAIGIVAYSTTQRAHGSGHWVLYFVAAIIGLIGLIPLFNFRASLKPSNWLLRCQLGGILIKYRAYENWHLSADVPQAVGLEHGEIAWARLVKETRVTPSTDSHGGSQSEYRTYVALGLVNPDTAELEARLAAERNLRPHGAIVVLDYPVQVQPGGVVEIRWGAGYRPSARKALQTLGARVKIAEPEKRRVDLTHHRGAPANPEADRAKILALLQNGQQFEAVKLARQAFGYSLRDAQAYVDNLRAGDKAL